MSTQPPRSKPVIGIVGGIGAGKSTAAAELAALGCRLVDADAIGHDLLAEEDVRREIRSRWGPGVFAPDGRVDRKSLASVVFARPADLEALNGILHPRIRRRMQQLIDQAMSDPAAAGVVVDAAVLFEAGWDDLCTHCVFVSAARDERRHRVASGRAWDEADWHRRENAQISLDIKAAKCDYTVDNCSSVPRLREQIRRIFHWICDDLS